MFVLVSVNYRGRICGWEGTEKNVDNIIMLGMHNPRNSSLLGTSLTTMLTSPLLLLIEALKYEPTSRLVVETILYFLPKWFRNQTFWGGI